MSVTFPRNPAERDTVECRRQRPGLLMQFGQPRMLDLPAPAHLFHDELGIHRHRNLISTKPTCLFESGDQTPVLGDVVGGLSDELFVFGQHGGAVGREHHAPESGRSGVSPGSPIGFDDDFHEPGPRTRNRIAPHSEHRSTSSSAAAVMRASSPRSSSIRQAPQRPPASRPAPTPDVAACRS